MHKDTHRHTYKVKVKLMTPVEGDLKAPFSIATTPKCRGGRYSILWIATLSIDHNLIMLTGTKYHFFESLI